MAQSYRSAQGQKGDEEGAWMEREMNLRGERRGLMDRLGGGEGRGAERENCKG